jgi:LacI family transcriptional regulator
MTNSGTAAQELSTSTVFELLDSAREVCSATIAQTDIQAESHRGRSTERRLIGVAINYEPRQLRLDGQHLEHVFYDDVLFGVRARAHSGDLDLLVLTELPERVAGHPSHYAEICRQHGAEGIILVAFDPQDHELAALADAGLPCVAIDTHVIGPRASFVSSDNVGGAVAAVLHLGRLGRTQIAYIGGVTGTVASSNRRLDYESALEELGLELREELALETDWRPETACELARRLLDSPRPPDAFFCASDELALGAMRAIEQAGRRIPEDVAVVGFDDADISRVVTPSLSSVRQDRIGLGVAAVEALLRVLEEPGAFPPVSVLPAELVVRESSSPRVAPGKGTETAPASSGASGRQSEIDPRLRLSITGALALLAPSNEPPAPGSGETTSVNEPETGRVEERRLLAVALGTTPDQSFPHGFFQGLFLAIRAQAAIEQAGLRIPDQIAVVGFDDIYYSSFVKPALTTVRQDRRKLAAAVVDAMFRLLDRPDEPPTVSVLPVELVVRESSGGVARSEEITE